MGTHWLYAFASAACRLFERPFAVAGLSVRCKSCLTGMVDYA